MLLGDSADDHSRSRLREGKTKVSRRPSPGLAARMRQLEEDAEKRANGGLSAKQEIVVKSQAPTREMFEEKQKKHEDGQSFISSLKSTLKKTHKKTINFANNNTTTTFSSAENTHPLITTTTEEDEEDFEPSPSEPDEIPFDEDCTAETAPADAAASEDIDREDMQVAHYSKELPPLPFSPDLQDDEERFSPLQLHQPIEHYTHTPPSSAEATPLPSDAPTYEDSPYRPRTTSSARPMTSQSSNFASEAFFPSTPPEPGNGLGGHTLQRRASLYSLSRVPFSAQLSRLTSLSLPLSSDLSESIKSLPTSQDACDVISASAKHIHTWIETAKKVLKGLDAEDDVEWAAQGRESLSEVDSAVNKFSSLVEVYVSVIDDLQTRPDINMMPKKVLSDIVSTMEQTLDSWKEVMVLLKDIKNQVETAMEWMELWSTILHDIQAELEACHTLVFEMEERRHRSMMEDSTKANGNVDLDALETIVEESLPTPAPAQPGNNTSEDSALLGLFARMQPLRASLDFLPMRLSSFEARASKTFPGACEDLENRRQSLEKKWKKLESDADGLKRELGEDKWVAIFRNAGRQAGSMLDSVERSIVKLKEALEYDGRGAEQNLIKRVESYEAKKLHYGTAITRVLAIMDRGLHDRLTVNGEILRLHTTMHERWENVESDMKELSSLLDDLDLSKKSQEQLRDSLSSIVSMDSFNTGLLSPGSSPASSVMGSTTSTNPPTRESSVAPKSKTLAAPRANVSNRLSVSPVSSRGNSPATSRLAVPRHTPSKPVDNRPRWSSTTTAKDIDTGHNFKPLSATIPSPYRKTPITPAAKSRIPCPSPLSQSTSPSGPLSPTSTASTASVRRIPPPSSRKGSTSSAPLFPPRSPSHNSSFLPAPERPGLRQQASMSRLATRTPRRVESPAPASQPAAPARPASAMASNRRVSYLPGKYNPPVANVGKRNSMPPKPLTPAFAASVASSGRETPAGTRSNWRDKKPEWK